MKDIKKINEIIELISENIITSDSMDKNQKLLIMEMLYLLLSNKEFAKYIQEK